MPEADAIPASPHPASPGPALGEEPSAAVRRVTRRLVVKATVGADAPERCAQALTVAATAAAGGAEVSLWLAAEGTWLAVPGRAASIELPGGPDLTELLAVVLGSGSVTVCARCAERRDISPGDLLPGAQIAGAAVFVAEILADSTQVLVY